jgi:hypothetical protein
MKPKYAIRDITHGKTWFYKDLYEMMCCLLINMMEYDVESLMEELALWHVENVREDGSYSEAALKAWLEERENLINTRSLIQ